MSKFKRGINFPNEGFVQNAIESYFNSLGYSRQDVQHVDLVCINVKNERWVIEAKGETSSIGVDFNTGLGQIIKRMDDSISNYAVAVPNISKFIYQINQVPNRVCKLLNLHWILVDEDGTIEIIYPEEY